MKLVHPNEALFQGEKPFPAIPCCEHFAGSEKLITKALSFQEELGPIFDITCDCEDGAATGQEEEHAEMIVKVLSSDPPESLYCCSNIMLLPIFFLVK